jgi:hypothetical protein
MSFRHSPRKFFKTAGFRALLWLAGWLLAVNLLPARAESVVTIQFLPQQRGNVVAADFVGLSFEMQSVLADTNGNHFFSPANQRLVAIFKQLGIKSLRLGGNTADRPTVPVPNRGDVDQLFAFARSADVKVIYTLRLNRGDPAAAAQMANYISRRYADQLDCFAIGNEPNVFSTNYDVYLAEWKRYAARITAPSDSPGAKFCGPGVSPGHEKWSAQFARDLATGGLLKYISQHDYPGGDARRVKNPETARDRILSSSMESHYEKFAANFMPVVFSNRLGCRLEEANSFYDGGAAGVSDTFASALWALNYQWWWAAHGLGGINFHSGDKVAARDENKPCRYATFWTAAGGYSVHPIGYAEKMFSLGSRGEIISLEISPATNLNFSAYAVRDDDGVSYATLINFSHRAMATNYSVQLGARSARGWREGKIIRLATPDGDVSCTSGVTLGGAEIVDDASWAGHWEKITMPSDQSKSPVTVELPAASAAVVKLVPR